MYENCTLDMSTDNGLNTDLNIQVIRAIESFHFKGTDTHTLSIKGILLDQTEHAWNNGVFFETRSKRPQFKQGTNYQIRLVLALKYIFVIVLYYWARHLLSHSASNH